MEDPCQTLLQEIIAKLYILRGARVYSDPALEDAWDHGIFSAITIIEPYLSQQ